MVTCSDTQTFRNRQFNSYLEQDHWNVKFNFKYQCLFIFGPGTRLQIEYDSKQTSKPIPLAVSCGRFQINRRSYIFDLSLAIISAN